MSALRFGESSPRPRGCSAPPPAPRSHSAVVPAPAGLFHRSLCHGGPPRKSSPRPRGCSGPVLAGGVEGHVVPAPAGLFPAPARSAASTTRRPRARGAVPTPGTNTSPPSSSSPRPRGCSQSSPLPRGLARVVPAPAGLFPDTDKRSKTVGRRPRARGAVPVVSAPIFAIAESSPRPRGCSHRHHRRQLRDRVVPAPAGLFP